MLDAEFVAAARRRRITDALAELCVEQGFATTTVAQIVGRAGTSRNSFYEVFPNRGEVFLGLLRRASDEFLAAFDSSAVVGEGGALEEGLGGALRWVAAHGAAAWALLIEAPCGGKEALAVQVGLTDALAARIAREYEGAPADLCLMCAGAVTTLVRGELFALRADGAPALAGELTALIESVLAPLTSPAGHRA